jgi:hypothetical protein
MIREKKSLQGAKASLEACTRRARAAAAKTCFAIRFDGSGVVITSLLSAVGHRAAVD